ncbi:pyrimidine/purine nucleoside phosphorylase [Chitinophaga silvisoli]|uniref:Pyrimidine/purine nucleoside phosphorylase n=1 Tax=Chitinophaga silvisoli TaxID=2291814 RepID=A0A3E1NUI8_9BACT|nr:pyrimidine/purine nucleoside phosphorylase [Chitinophaga silvisoli]RFM31577.1 pyrimidine/purine nucleoside phosphorylase [Chitinophaga silvisoli]
MSSSNAPDIVSHNVYFDGKVQSLGIATEKGRATVGVMKKGTYVFNTSSPEVMEVITGTMSTKLSGGEWLHHKKGDSFEVAGNSSFEVVCETEVAYICYYH